MTLLDRTMPATAGMSSRRHVLEQRLLHRIERGIDVDDLGMTLLDGGIRVFETVAREGANDLAAGGDLAVLDVAQRASQRRGRRRFADNAFLAREQALCGEDFLGAAFVEPATRFLLGDPGPVPALRMADAERGRNGFGVVDRAAPQNRRRARGLITYHGRQAVDDAVLFIFLIAHPVRGNIAGIAYRQAMIIGRALELLDDFEGGGLLPLQAKRVDGVDDGDWRFLAVVFHQFHAVVEIAFDLDHHRAVDHRLREFAHGDLAIGYQHERGNAGARRILRSRGRGVAGGGADDGAAALFHRLGHRHGHAAVLERAGGGEPFVLDVDVDVVTHFARDVDEADQRRVAFAETDDARVVMHRQTVTVFVDQSSVTGTEWHAGYSSEFTHWRTTPSV